MSLLISLFCSDLISIVYSSGLLWAGRGCRLRCFATLRREVGGGARLFRVQTDGIFKLLDNNGAGGPQNLGVVEVIASSSNEGEILRGECRTFALLFGHELSGAGDEIIINLQHRYFIEAPVVCLAEKNGRVSGRVPHTNFGLGGTSIR